MASIRRAVPGDAQKIGVVFDAAVREAWTYLGELARDPMFPPEEWDKLVIGHAPPNVLLVAINEPDDAVGFTPVHPREGEMFLLFVHPENGSRNVSLWNAPATERLWIRSLGICDDLISRGQRLNQKAQLGYLEPQVEVAALIGGLPR